MKSKKHARIRLTVGISCYLKTDFFTSTLDSVLAVIGTRPDIELLICDDGISDDGDGCTAREYEARFPNKIRIIRNDTRHGIRHSYNRLVEESRGEYFMPFDSDDILLPFDLDRDMAMLDTHPEFAATYGKKYYYDKEHVDLVQEGGGDHSAFLMTIRPRTTHNAMIIRTADLKATGGYASPLYSEDVQGPVDISMWVALSLEKDLFFVDEFRLLYRVHPAQASQQENYSAEINKIRRGVRAHYPDLAAAIHEKHYYFVRPEMVRAAEILFGAEFTEPELTDEERRILLEEAESLSPDDLGIWEARLNFFLQLKRWRELYEAAHVMYAKSIGRRFSELFALTALIEASKKLALPTAAFEELKKRTSLEFFQLTEPQQRILKSILKNNGKNLPDKLEQQP